MNINMETKYSVGDKVYVIAEVAKYNDWYRNETKWVVAEDTSKIAWNPPLVPLEIEQIVIKYVRKYKVLYEVQGYFYQEKDMFNTLEEAQTECKKRNKEL